MNEERYLSSAYRIELGQIAYTAYGNTVEWKNYQGLPMPTWEELTEKIREAWIAAASAVADEVK